MPKVTVDGVEYVPAERRLQVGDFVQVQYMAYRRANEGKYGKVLLKDPRPSSSFFLVEFAEPFDLGGSGGGTTKSGHGYWYEAAELRRVD